MSFPSRLGRGHPRGLQLHCKQIVNVITPFWKIRNEKRVSKEESKSQCTKVPPLKPCPMKSRRFVGGM